MVPADYALLTTQATAAKPIAFPDIQALARRIHRERRGEALLLSPQTLRFQDGEIRKVTVVYGVDQIADRRRFIGYAWHKAGDWRALEAAIEAVEPPTVGAAA